MNRRIVKLWLVVVLSLLALPMLLGLECYTSDVFKTGGGSDTIPDGGERVLWTFDANTSPEPMESPVMYSSPAIASDGTIYIGSYDNYIYAIDIEGNRTWGFKTGGDVLTSPAVGPDGSVYVGSADGSLYAFSPYGEKKWEYEACSGADGGVDTRVTPAVGSFTP